MIRRAAFQDKDEACTESPVSQAVFCCRFAENFWAVVRRTKSGGHNIVEGLKARLEANRVNPGA